MKKMNTVPANVKNITAEPTSVALDLLESEIVEENISADEFDVSELASEYIGDSITLYLNDIGKYSLLTSEEELALAQIVSEGGSEALEARNKLVMANLRLVMHYAKKYVGRGVELDDLNIMGIEGLIRAAEKFDYSLGYRFSTYATWWIKQSMARGIADEGATVRIPVHLNEFMGKITKAKKEYVQQNFCEPTVAEIAEIIGESEAKVKRAMDSMYSMVSFDTKIGEDGDSTYEDFLPDKNAVNPCDHAMMGGLKEAVDEALTMLAPNEALVLRLRNGIGCERTYTLEEIARRPEFGVTRERVRQIENKAYLKIKRNPNIMKLLRDFVA